MNRGHGLYDVRAANRLDARFGKTEVPNLTFDNQIFDGSGDVFNGYVRIDAMLVKEIPPV